MEASFEETVLKKLERVSQDQELLLKQLQAMSREPVKSIEEAVEKTLAKVNDSQLATIEKVNNVQSQLDKISGSHSRLNRLQNELKTEITNRTFLQNELSKDLDGLNEFVKSGRSPSRLISEKLNDLAKELFMIGVHQNEFTNSLNRYKRKLLVEIQKMTIDLSYVVDKRLESEEEKNRILERIKAINEVSGGKGECTERGENERSGGSDHKDHKVDEDRKDHFDADEAK